MADDLRRVLNATTTADPTTRKLGEQTLGQMERKPGFAQLLVQMIEASCAGTTQDDKSMRTLGAIVFKNLVKKAWVQPEDGDGFELNPMDKDAIKGSMVHIMCIAPPEVQRQFSEALAIISRHDFPANWPNLLPELVNSMTITNDYGVITGVLLTANSILKRFRYVFKSDALFTELLYVLGLLSAPLTELFQKTSMALSSGCSPQQLQVMFEALRLMARIFFSLNWQDLPEFFEDNINTWMSEFGKFLAYGGPQPPVPQDENAPGGLERLQAAIVENVNLYASKYDEEFQPFLPLFTSAVWELLVKTGTGPRHDMLATTCIRFLSSIIGKQIHVGLFADQDRLRQVVEHIVVPNMLLRESDEELFEDNPIDYLQRDMEGSDSDTRRRGACDLVRAMCKHHEETATRLCVDFITKMLVQYSSAPATHWRSKDAALQLILALAVKSASAAHGVSETNAYINVMDVYNQHVVPEVADPAINERPIVRADCLKFISTFRNHFTIEQLRQLFPVLIRHLASEHVVVATYAAVVLERILVLKMPTTAGAPKQKPIFRFGKDELVPFLESLFTGLFAVLDNPDIAENEYVMRAIMRALCTAQEKVVVVAQIVLQRQTAYLARVCRNPSNPHFNHFLFESIAVIVGKVCEADTTTIDVFEGSLFPPFQEVLAHDVVEFAPYVFQILAQLLELRPGGFTPAYTQLFPPLLNPTLWERKGNVPALTRLLQAYLHKDANSLVVANHLPGILGVFQKLLSQKATENHAFSLLCSIIGNLQPAQFEQYVKELFNMILLRLQSNKTERYVRHMTHFFSYVVCKHGVGFLVQILESIQPGMLVMILNQVWLPGISGAGTLDHSEEKVFTVGMSKLLCEPPIGASDDTQLWGKILQAIMQMLASEDDKTQDGGIAGLLMNNDMEEEETAFDSVYCKLHYATTGAGKDLVPDVPDHRVFLAQQLSSLFARYPGKYSSPALQQLLPAAHFQLLQQTFHKAGIVLA